MLSAKIAFRNILARKQTSLLIFLIMASVTFLLFTFLLFSDGEIENIRNGISSFDRPFSDYRLFTQDFVQAEKRGDSPLEFTIKGSDELGTKLRKMPFVQEVFPFNFGLTMELHSAKVRFYDLLILKQDSTNQALKERYTIVDGTGLDQGSRGKIILHVKMRDNFSLQVGDQATLIGKDYFGQAASRKVVIVGFFRPAVDHPDLTERVLTDPDTFSSLSGFDLGENSGLSIRLKRGETLESTYGKLNQWCQTNNQKLILIPFGKGGDNSGYTLIYIMIRWILISMVLLTLGLAAFGVMTLVSANLRDRRKEIGTYFCLGSGKGFLKLVYTLELLMVNVAACLTGIAAGLLLRLGVNQINFQIDDPGFQTVAGSDHFYLGISSSSIVIILGGVILITILASLFTLGRALDVSPVVAVREAE